MVTHILALAGDGGCDPFATDTKLKGAARLMTAVLMQEVAF